MIEVGAFEAKTRLSSLLDKVTQGEEVLITRRGVPVARLVAVGEAQQVASERVIEGIRRLRWGVKLGGLDWKKLRDEGRR